MTGSPILRLALASLLFVVLGVPVWSLTQRRRPEIAGAVPARAASTRAIELHFTATEAPQLIEIDYEGASVSRIESRSTTIRATVELAVPEEGGDLVIRATWPSTVPHALRVQAECGGSKLADSTLWGDANLEDVVILREIAAPR